MADYGSSRANALGRRSVLLGTSAMVAAVATLNSAETMAQTPANPLDSWNDGSPKQAILDFVRTTTDQSSRNFVPPEDRIATFDQDGTLWTEHPLYAQAAFALYRVHELAPQHPEWQTQEPFRSALSNDPAAVGRFTERDWFEIVAATHSGMSTNAFVDIVAQWLAAAKDPRFKRPYTDLVYQPMLEVMEYLRVNGFRTYFVTGGGQDIRACLCAARVWRSTRAGCGVARRDAV